MRNLEVKMLSQNIPPEKVKFHHSDLLNYPINGIFQKMFEN